MLYHELAVSTVCLPMSCFLLHANTCFSDSLLFCIRLKGSRSLKACGAKPWLS
jgi:hypothetical protein